MENLQSVDVDEADDNAEQTRKNTRRLMLKKVIKPGQSFSASKFGRDVEITTSVCLDKDYNFNCLYLGQYSECYPKLIKTSCRKKL